MNFFPKRIICLTEEPVETLYLLGEQERIVGVSGFAVRPPRVRKEKPVISTFTEADIDKIITLKPDLVIGFSDIQSEIAKDLISKGITVWINNYRTVEGIFNMIGQLGSLVGQAGKAMSLINKYRRGIDEIYMKGKERKHKPKVYFEEWYDPLISGICWVSELIELAGGVDVYKDRQNASLAKDRIIKDKNEVVKLNPDIIMASWCGKKFKKEKLVERENWNTISAVKHDFIFEVKSPIILQPGPAAVTEGIRAIADIIDAWHSFQH